MSSSIETINNLPAIQDNKGEFRVLGSLTPSQELRGAFRTFAGAGYPELARKNWKPVDYRSFRRPTKDQKQLSACAGFSAALALEYHRVIAGMPPVKLSGTYPYAYVNGGKDQGASLSAILKVQAEVGNALESDFGIDKYYLKQISPEVKKSALDNRIQEGIKCRNFDEICSALCLYGPTPLGIAIGRNFSKLNKKGVCPLPDVSVGGHAITGVALDFFDAAWHNLIQNSWTESWGFDGGFGWLTEGHFQQLVDGFVCVMPRESDRTDDGDEPPVVPAKKVSVAVPEKLPAGLQVGEPAVAPVSVFAKPQEPVLKPTPLVEATPAKPTQPQHKKHSQNPNKR